VVLVLIVTFAPLAAATPTTNMIGFAVLASALMLYGGTRLLPATGAGVLVVFFELENAWNKHPLTIEIAAALAGLALLTAFELRTWAEELARVPADRVAYRAKATLLASRLGLIAAILAVLVVLAHGLVHGPIYGLFGGLGAIALGLALVWLSARPGKA
jgi:hypothetical protein